MSINNSQKSQMAGTFGNVIENYIKNIEESITNGKSKANQEFEIDFLKKNINLLEPLCEENIKLYIKLLNSVAAQLELSDSEVSKIIQELRECDVSNIPKMEDYAIVFISIVGLTYSPREAD